MYSAAAFAFACLICAFYSVLCAFYLSHSLARASLCCVHNNALAFIFTNSPYNTIYVCARALICRPDSVCPAHLGSRLMIPSELLLASIQYSTKHTLFMLDISTHHHSRYPSPSSTCFFTLCLYLFIPKFQLGDVHSATFVKPMLLILPFSLLISLRRTSHRLPFSSCLLTANCSLLYS